MAKIDSNNPSGDTFCVPFEFSWLNWRHLQGSGGGGVSTNMSYFDPEIHLVDIVSTLVGVGGLCVNCVPNGKSPLAGSQVGGRWHIMS